VPAIVQNQLSSVLKKTAHWEVDIQNIVFNPYALSLELTQARFIDAQSKTVIGFERLYINFSALHSLTGAISFDEISLERPLVNLNIDEQGQTNFQNDFASDKAVETEPEETSGIIPLFFGLIAISEGQINISDHSQGEVFELSFKPLGLSLKEFSTQHNEGGDYSLAISLGDGQKIDWKGQFGVAPIQSKGHLSLQNIRSKTFWHYVKAYSPYWLNNARISLAGEYNTQIDNQKTHFQLKETQLSIQDIKLAPNEETPDFLQLQALDIGPIDFDLDSQTLSLGHINLDTPEITALRHTDSSINILKPLQEIAGEEEIEKTTNVEKDSNVKSAFKWAIANVQISKGSIHWQDQSLTTPADIKIDKIGMSLSKLSQDLSVPLPYQLDLSTGEAAHNLSGSISPVPFVVDGQLKIQKFPLKWMQSYLSESANVILDSGTATIDSQYKLSIEDKPIGEITTNFQLDKLAVSDALLEKPLSGFEQLSINPIVISLNEKTSINVDTVRLVKPYGDVFIAEDGQMNLAKLSVEKPEQTTKEPTDPPIQTQEEQNPPHIQISKFEIQEARFEFTDASQSPHFNSYFDQITGSIENLSSNLDAQSKVDIQGNLETYGKLVVQGTLNPLSQKPNTDLSINVSNIDLSTASPYSARFAGYLIDKGKLDLNLNYKINDKKLDAENHIFIDQFEFGDSVDSPDATSLPLPLAIGIMKNLDGEIDIDLPISGDLNDPSFSVGSVVLTAFTNLITTIVTSPFSMLGALVEGGDDISSVEFLAAQTDLNINQTANIMKLADALKDRPNLNLEIRGIADSSIDSTVKQALTPDLLKRLAKDRALTMANVIIKEGGIKKERIFVLEPQVINTNAKPKATEILSVPSNFTLSVK